MCSVPSPINGCFRFPSPSFSLPQFVSVMAEWTVGPHHSSLKAIPWHQHLWSPSLMLFYSCWVSRCSPPIPSFVNHVLRLPYHLPHLRHVQCFYSFSVSLAVWTLANFWRLLLECPSYLVFSLLFFMQESFLCFFGEVISDFHRFGVSSCRPFTILYVWCVTWCLSKML